MLHSPLILTSSRQAATLGESSAGHAPAGFEQWLTASRGATLGDAADNNHVRGLDSLRLPTI